MPWNESTKTLTAPFTKIAANGQGDLQKALSSSLMSQIRLFTETNINPMAKYKPIKSSKLIITDSDRENARYGFGAIPSVSPSTFQTAPAKWVYQKPTAGAPNEWLRALDFDGYNKDCCAPFLLVVEEQYTAGSPIRIQIETNHRVDDYPGYNWQGAYNLTLEELLLSDRQSNEYVHLFIKKTSGAGAGTLNIVVLKNDSEGNAMPLTALAPNSTPRGTGVEAAFLLYPDGDGGYHCPAVPVLQNAVSGDAFVMYAAFGTIPGSVDSNYYQVYTSIPAMTWKSLNLNGQNNNSQFAMTQLVNNVSGSISDVYLEATSDYFTDASGNYYRKFIIKRLRASVTTGSLNVGDGVNMNFHIAFDGSEGTMYGPIGVVQNNEIVERNSFVATFRLYSNQSYTEYFCEESTGFTDRYFWALWDGDPDDTYQVGVSCMVERQNYPNVALNSGHSNVVHFQ